MFDGKRVGINYNSSGVLKDQSRLRYIQFSF